MAKAATTKAAASAAKKPTAKAGSTAAQAVPAAAPVTAAPPATITLKHLAAGVGDQHGLDKKQAEAVVAAVFEAVTTHLKAGERVRIGGFGIIEVKDRPARTGRNPATGEAIQIAASRKLAFRAAKELKALV
jgi:DNA-binding protein HU-beta